MSTEPSTSMRSVTLREGESISLLTGQVFAPANEQTGPWWELPRYVERRLIANDLNALRSTFAITACAWTEEACHRYVDHCTQHPRSTRPEPASLPLEWMLRRNDLDSLADWFEFQIEG
jgi:hypothetical protein